MFVDLSPPMSVLVSTLCTTMLYGVNIVTFFTCVYVLVQRRVRGGCLPWFLFGDAVAQFILSSVHMANSWQVILEVFIWNGQISGASASSWDTDPVKLRQTICRLLLIISCCLTDSGLLWRLYRIWDKDIYVCGLTLAMMTTYTVTYCVGIRHLIQVTSDSDIDVALPWLIAGLTLSLITNASVTCLIVWRVWLMSHCNGGFPAATRCTTVVRTFLEFGAVYSVLMVFLVVFTAMKLQVGCLISSIFVQLCGIIPALVIVRVGPGLVPDRAKDASLPVQFIRGSKFFTEECSENVKPGSVSEHDCP